MTESTDPTVDPAAAPEGTVVDTPTDSAVVTPVEDAPPAEEAPVEPVDSAQTPPVDAAPTDAPVDPAPVEQPSPDASSDPSSGPVADPAGEGTDVQAAPEVDSSTEEPTSTEVQPDSSEPSGGTQVNVQANAEDAAATPVEEQASTEAPDVPDAPVIETPHVDEEFADNMVHVSGTAEPSGATVTVYADSRAIGTASVDDKGDWSLEANLPNAEYVLSASVNDIGKVSERSEGVHIIVNHDAGAPAPEPSSDPDVRFAEFLRAKLLRGYPLRWERITELQAAAEAWIADKGL